MPLFFFLTGITYNVSAKLDIFIIKKINRIVVPWIFFSIASAIFELIFGRINQNMPFNGPLWFLQTLMCAILIYVVIHSIFPKLLHVICFSLPVLVYVITVYTNWASILPFNIIRALEAVFYIHLGWCFKKYLRLGKVHIIFLLVICIIGYLVGLWISLSYFDVKDASFINTRMYTYNLPLSLITSIAGLLIIVLFSQLVSKIQVLNWMGKNSLVIMCVHFPLQERLNELCFYCFSNLDLTIYMKLGLAVVSYCITVGFSIIVARGCRKYCPKLTGYDNLVTIASR